MEFTPQSAIIALAWIAIAFLASALAGLVIRVAELNKTVRSLHIIQGGRIPQAYLTKGALKRLAQHGEPQKPFAALVIDPQCFACRHAVDDFANHTGEGSAHASMLVLSPSRASYSIGTRLKLVLDEQLCAEIPGDRPTLIFGNSQNVTVTSIQNSDELKAALSSMRKVEENHEQTEDVRISDNRRG